GSAHEGQAECDVDAVAEARVLEHWQALIVVHRQHAVKRAQPLWDESRVGRDGADKIESGVAQRRDNRLDDVDLFAPEIAAFTGMRVQATDGDARLRNTELGCEVGGNNTEGGRQ